MEEALKYESNYGGTLSKIIAGALGLSICLWSFVALHAQGEIPKLVANQFGGSNPSVPYSSAGQRGIPSYPAGYIARAYLADGFIGIRPNPNPLSQSQTIAAGYVFTSPKDDYEMASPAPYPLGADIRVNGSSILDGSARLLIESQTLDMSDAELVTKMKFINVPSGPQLDIEVTQFLARSVPSLLCQEIRITSSEDTAIQIDPQIQRQGIPGTPYRQQPVERTRPSRALGMVSDRGSKVGIAVVVPLQPNLTHTQDDKYELMLRRGEPGTFREIAAVITSAYDPAPDEQAIRVASWGEMLGFNELRNRNRDAWSELWKSRVLVTGDMSAQRKLDAAFFYLHSSSHAGLFTGVPPFGTSQWLDYSGHAFWDMDAWIMPSVLPADPEAAEAMVRFRHRGLRAAEDKAASFGFQGAMYPWEAGVDGSEVTPAWAATGWDEQHVIPEVALSAWEYYEATADTSGLHEYVWPIVYQVAEWITHRGKFTAKGYEIENLMGANEGIENVKNESMVMMLCKMVMGDAIKAAQAMKTIPPDLWTRVYDALYIPLDQDKNVLLPFSLDSPVMRYDRASDQFKTVNVMDDANAYTLENAPMLVLHDPPISRDLFKRTWDYEEKRRAELTSPTAAAPAQDRAPGFTTPPMAVCAAMFGDRDKAAEFFNYAASQYSVSPFMLSVEYQKFRDGNYLMNQASLLMSAMYGFTGLRISDGDWRKYPVSLPRGWTRIEMQRIWIHGVAYHLIAEQGKRAQLVPID